jgi:ABC-2 type transport system permease protein
LLASAWARRAPLLWATAPIGAVWLLEYQALGTNHIGHLLQTRLLGAIPLATSVPKGLFNDHAQTSETVLHITDVLAPGTFFSSPQVWIGVAVAAALIVAAVWVRRYREEA